MRRLFIFFIVPFLCNNHFSYSQTAYVNTPYGIYELKGGAGSCSFVPVANPCGPDVNLLSMTLFKDTVYYTLFTGELKRFKIGVPGSCQSLGQVGMGNSLTVDKNGILYMAGGLQLASYNPYTNHFTNLGTMPCGSSGDLIFYKDKLLLAGRYPNSPAGGIFEININDPSASTIYMNTGTYSFYGLISFPVACSKSRFFGLASTGINTEMVELDLENKTILSSCSIPLEVYDAASSTENGYDDNVFITHLNIYSPCTPLTKGIVEIAAFYASQGDIIYKLDNAISNTTGIFPDIAPGTHTITAIAPTGSCSKDTSFTILPALPLVNHVDTRQSHCDLNNGWIKIKLNTDTVNAYSSINNGPFEHTFLYSNLAPGNYYVQVKNGPGCYFDTSITMQRINDTKPEIGVQTKDQVCLFNNGAITLSATGNDFPYSYALDSGNYSGKNEFTGLPPAYYSIHIKNSFDCQWDTFAVVAAYTLFPVSANIEHIDPTCRGIHDGTIKVNIAGSQNPYYFTVDHHWFNNGQTVAGLTEGNHLIQIKNGDQCTLDSINQVLKINFEPGCNDVFIPNAFTPNHDGKNDLFRPVYSYFIKKITMKIYNRFGQKLYEASGSNISWDGTYKGAMQPPDVYVYTLNYTDYFDRPKFLKGTVALIR